MLSVSPPSTVNGPSVPDLVDNRKKIKDPTKGITRNRYVQRCADSMAMEVLTMGRAMPATAWGSVQEAHQAFQTVPLREAFSPTFLVPPGQKRRRAPSSPSTQQQQSFILFNLLQ